ncbi:MAG: bile acid:sodium symporter family protein [Chitinophagales bacterium]|nr:bile acid:sodium symporter family protein [Saprospiraceae bacterium]MBK8680598.1 bile acid:sodium symporter family protein [Bacteroidota bacterium]MBP7399392.1 bile acid:sodium symporter family protein [Chitinophagales bacterium]MBP9190018.1 bile acid:sodium symporter family protein [Chitinophagales bacterium]MBP9548988.1 bile acid:sodium symporter family protein [Chitinophagales bacterium]
MAIDEIRLHMSEGNLLLLNFLLAFLMFGIALNLRTSDFKRLFMYPRKAVAGILSQWIVLPFLTYLLILIFQPSGSVALGLILVAACPGGNMSNFLSSYAKANVALSVTLTAFSTVICVFMTPFNFALYGNLYAPARELLIEISIEPWKMYSTVFTILGVPLTIGMLFAHFLPRITAFIIKPVRIISLIIFIAFIVFAFLANYSIFLEVIQVIFLLVFLHNIMALFSGYGIAALFRLDFIDKKCIAIETGIQNAALGLILIFTFFNGLGGMAVTAGWWGIWDLITGLAIAYYWNRLDARSSQRTVLPL